LLWLRRACPSTTLDKDCGLLIGVSYKLMINLRTVNRFYIFGLHNPIKQDAGQITFTGIGQDHNNVFTGKRGIGR